MTTKIIDPERVSAGKALKGVLLNFCIAFTLFVLFCCIFGLIFADEAAKPGIIMCLTIGGACLAAVFLQLVFFTPVFIKHMGYVSRLTLFGVCLYFVLAACGAAFQWFPADNAGAWAGFTVCYLAILAFMTVVFTLIHKRSIKALNEGLERFKQESTGK